MKEFNTRSLAEHNGQDEKPAYIAYNGKVFDVASSKRWKAGMHMKRHQAGSDLSEELAAAPHGNEVFERVQQVGVLVDKDEAEKEQLPPWLAKFLDRFPFFRRHPHPMLVHYPIVFSLSATGFILLAMITGNISFETTALHCLGAALLFTPLSIGSGFLTWWINYQARPMRPVRIKILFSFLLLLDVLIIFFWRLQVPDVLSAGGSSRVIFLTLICALVPLTSVIGWFGALLTFPLAKEE